MVDKILKIVKKPLFAPAISLILLIGGFIFGRTGAPLVSAVLFGFSVLICGIPVFRDAVLGLCRRDFLDEKFLMSIAAIGAFFIGEFSEGAAVMIFYRFGEWLEKRAVAGSRASIKALMDIRPDTARVLRDGKTEEVDADDVGIGETFIVRTGERIPLDGRIVRGDAGIDTSALTGESLPRNLGVGDTVESGYLVLSGVLTCTVLHTADNSAAARVLELVEDASERKSKEERFITKFSRIYTPAVVAAALLIALIPPLFGILNVKTSVYRALMFLVISCPCALLISVPLTFFCGIGGAARLGVLFKGGNTFSAVSRVFAVAFDKTGTLTAGSFRISEVKPRRLTAERLLAVAASAEYYSGHPIAVCLRGAVKDPEVPATVTEIPGAGIRAEVKGQVVLAGNEKLFKRYSVSVPENGTFSESRVLIAVDGSYEGYIAVSDTLKPEAAETIGELKKLGVKKTALLSGDRKEMALAVGKELGMDEIGFELTPEDKYKKLEEMQKGADGTLMYVGDGINDAPALALADVGVSMGKIGQDSAIEASDVVMMSDRLDKLPVAIRVARKTLRIARENIAFALTVKLGILALAATGLLDAFGGMWLAVFADVGVCVLDVLNACRALKA